MIISNLFLKYLRFFARLQIQKVRLLQKINNKKLTIVGITGSAGKSSTLLICQSALKNSFQVKTNDGFNSESGLPLSILGLKISNYTLFSWLKMAFLAPIKLLTNWQSYDILLLEMGIDSPVFPKNMGFLLSIANPDIGIFLNVTSVHLFNFKDINHLAQEKAKLANHAHLAIINSADPLVKKYTTNKNQISIVPTTISIPNTYIPEVYHLSFGAALALGKSLGLDESIIIKNIQANFVLPPSRSSVLEGIKGSKIIDSSYNSSPLACLEMLNFLDTFPSPKIAILGDMRELGSNTEIEHKKIYKKALEVADLIIGVGPETQKYFISKNIPDHIIAHNFQFWWQAASFIKNNSDFLEKSAVLVKGSQNTIFLEEIVKTLLKNKSDVHKICRQSPYWLKTKKEFKQKFEQ